MIEYVRIFQQSVINSRSDRSRRPRGGATPKRCSKTSASGFGAPPTGSTSSTVRFTPDPMGTEATSRE
ncbi:hypothetical protein C8039_19415 [Halogeometricum sp. wsp3]|nr:hypothetical protein C8039_19415 [Halogeometricum sp. wsp3]